MSNFSEMLKYLIEESEIKIYQLAKKSGLDRTTIQRSMSGERLPSLSFVEKLADYLRLSPAQRDELFNQHSISKIGEEVYAGRKFIKEMIVKMATTHSVGESVANTHKSISYTGKINEDNAVYEGQYLINSMIRDVLEDEVVNNLSPKISLSVPFNCNFLYDLLYQLYLSENGNIEINNLIRLNKISAFQNGNYNLEMLSHVIPFSFSGGYRYQVYYYYDNFDCSKDISLLMPYYIITSTRLITISADFNTAILYNNQSIVKLYKEKFTTAIHKSSPLFTQIVNCDDVLLTFIQLDETYGAISHVIEPQPCIAWYYTDELIDAHLRQDLDNREIILPLVYDFYRKYRSRVGRPMSIFSIEGLSSFANTGILEDLPPQFAIPFTFEERIFLLENLRNDILLNNYQVYAVNSSKFNIPLVSIQLFNKKGLNFCNSSINEMVSWAYIDEKSITEAFTDFFESLPSSDLIYSIDETVKIIDRFIEQCTLIGKASSIS